MEKDDANKWIMDDEEGELWMRDSSINTGER